MGETCSIVGREEKYMRVISQEKLKKRNRLKFLGVHESIILKWILKKEDEMS